VAAGYVYPPLDGDPIYWLGLIVFLLPIGTAIAAAIRTRRRGQTLSPLLSVLFKLSAIFLTALTVVVFLNGRLDRSSVMEIHTKVAGKFMARGRFSMSYHLAVASWRHAGREEDLRVSRHVYDRANSGDDISVQLHGGWFGLPWYGRIVLARKDISLRQRRRAETLRRVVLPAPYTAGDEALPRSAS
jgi:hypothetical protein